MIGLTPDRTAETKLSGANGDRENEKFLDCLADHKQDWLPYPVAESAESDDHTHTHTHK